MTGTRAASAVGVTRRIPVTKAMALAVLATLLTATSVSAAMSSQPWPEPPPPEPAVDPAVDPAYQWPLPGPPPVTRRFTPPAQRWLAGHRGVDLAAVPGAVVYAAGAGVVFFAGPVAGRGVISIDHQDGLRTTYEPVVASVAVGELVAAGDPIGLLEPGHAGCATSACLHWGLRQGEVYLDPLSLLGLGRVRLLPRPPAGQPDR